VKTNASVTKIEDLTADGGGVPMNPKFEIRKNKAGKFRFLLKAKNGEIIGMSEGYTTKQNCLNRVESVMKNAFQRAAENSRYFM